MRAYFYRICVFVLYLSCSLSLTLCAETSTLRFDMGTPESPLTANFTRITPADTYTASKGYGWKSKPAAAFDRTKSRCKAAWYQKFWGTQVVGDQPYYGEPVDDLWRDGIADKKDMVFRVDVPNGIYNVWATVGDEEWTRLDMNVEAEGELKLEDIRTWIFWGAYPAHRRMMFRVEVKDKSLDLRFFNHAKDIPVTMDTVETVHEVVNSVLALEIEPYVPPRLALTGGRLSADNALNSAELKRGFELYSKGKYDDALEVWETIDSERADEIKGILYGWVAGVVTRNDEIQLLDKAVTHLEHAARRFPGDESIAQTLQRTVDFRDGLLIFRGENHAIFSIRTGGYTKNGILSPGRICCFRLQR